MLLFDRLRKKVKCESFEKKIDFKLRTISKNNSQNVDFKHVKKRLLMIILSQVRSKLT